MRALVLVALAGCWSCTPPPVATLSHTTPVPATCVPRTRAGDAIVQLRAASGLVKLCLAEPGFLETEQPPWCVMLDGRGRVAREAPWTGWPDTHPAYDLTLAAGVHTVCARADRACRSFRSGHGAHGYLDDAGGVSDDGSRAFVLEERAGAIIGELWDVDRGKRLAEVDLSAHPEHGFHDASITQVQQLVGSSHAIIGEYPAGPGGRSVLVDPLTGKMRYLHEYQGSSLVLDERSLLVLDGHELSVVDVATLSISKLATIPGTPFEDPEPSSARMERIDDAVLIAYAQPPGVVIFDRATKRLGTPSPLLLCP